MIAWWRGFYGLFFPNLCFACLNEEKPWDDILCVPCKASLPVTGQYLHLENGFTDRFWGRFQLEGGAAYLFFQPESKVQNLIHALKYRYKKSIGTILGYDFGNLLISSPYFQSIDLIVPVPLHPKKLSQRGYNQSECIGSGIGSAMGIECNGNAISRVRDTATQTGMGRMERLDNMMISFEVKYPEIISGKSILLVDDVLTTGATLEACAQVLIKAGASKIYMATLAMAID
jgi:ComF family protein